MSKIEEKALKAYSKIREMMAYIIIKEWLHIDVVFWAVVAYTQYLREQHRSWTALLSRTVKVEWVQLRNQLVKLIAMRVEDCRKLANKLGMDIQELNFSNNTRAMTLFSTDAFLSKRRVLPREDFQDKVTFRLEDTRNRKTEFKTNFTKR